MSWRSTDGGKTWSQGLRVNDVPESTREGLHGLAAAQDGTVWASGWIFAKKACGSMERSRRTAERRGAAISKIYVSPDGHICECCHPTAYIGPQGELYAMWRNWLSGSRDMYYAVSTDRKTWAAPEDSARALGP